MSAGPFAAAAQPEQSKRDQIVGLVADVAIALLKAAPAIIDVELERRGYARPASTADTSRSVALDGPSAP